MGRGDRCQFERGDKALEIEPMQASGGSRPGGDPRAAKRRVGHRVDRPVSVQEKIEARLLQAGVCSVGHPRAA
ncbi:MULTISPECIES: hypothetical protein [unclassified Nonomuraea]|uniref:hypothetical protein n=1 Tax=unclassified Nonomuraea TaxID=2593643 RepID=UPI0033F8F5B0